MTQRIVIQGHDRHGWDCEEVSSMADIRNFLNHPHHGEIWFYCHGKEFLLPRGIGRRYVLPISGVKA